MRTICPNKFDTSQPIITPNDVLIVVDMQNDFIDGSFTVRDAKLILRLIKIRSFYETTNKKYGITLISKFY